MVDDDRVLFSALLGQGRTGGEEAAMTLRYQILCGGELIGTSKLEGRDPSMGTAWGSFTPSQGYERVRWVFRIFSEALSDTGPANQVEIARYYSERDKLDLTVRTPEGEVVPTSVVHIADFSGELGEGAYEIEVHLDDPSFFGG
jgi:hypothetical protein